MSARQTSEQRRDYWRAYAKKRRKEMSPEQRKALSDRINAWKKLHPKTPEQKQHTAIYMREYRRKFRELQKKIKK